MITWRKTGIESWDINYKNKIFKIKTLEQLWVYSIAFGIPEKEIEYALLEMTRQNHEYCEFGSRKKTFIFSKNLNEGISKYDC